MGGGRDEWRNIGVVVGLDSDLLLHRQRWWYGPRGVSAPDPKRDSDDTGVESRET